MMMSYLIIQQKSNIRTIYLTNCHFFSHNTNITAKSIQNITFVFCQLLPISSGKICISTQYFKSGTLFSLQDNKKIIQFLCVNSL